MPKYTLLDDEPSVQPSGAKYMLLDDEPPKKSGAENIIKGVGNLGAGLVRGAGSIGATLLAPVDVASDLMKGRGLSLQSNRERRAAMDAALQDMGAETDSWMYKGGKLGGELAGTAGVGSALAGGARLAGAAPSIVRALETAGMTTGANPVGFGARAADLALRSGAGAAVGGASAGLANPEDAGMGAVIGGSLPVATKVAGAIGDKVGSAFRGPAQSKETTEAIKAAREAGYVIPPSQANPTLGNRLLEGYAGKLSTAQNASAKNAQVTNDLAATALGLPKGTQINTEVLDTLRKDAGKAYEAISNLGKLDATRAKLPSSVQIEESVSPLLQGKTKSVDSGEIVRAWKQANADATAYYRAYARDANPETLAKAKSNADAARKIDDFLSMKLKDIGQSKLGDELKDARRLIAKTYSVENALNVATGTIDARKLAKQLQKGKPLSGELKQAAEFAERFKTAAQVPETMGSLPQFSPLDWAAGGTMGAVTGNPLYIGLVAGRPVARSMALSDLVQNRLAAEPQSKLANLLRNKEAQQLMYRAAPIMADQ